MKNLLKIFVVIIANCMLFIITCSAADRFWIAGTTADWNNTANWSTTSGGSGGASVPGSSDVAKFDGNGTGSCSINATVNVAGMDIGSGYTGTIAQGSYVVTVGSSNFTMAGGSFVGGSSNIDVNGLFTLSGGDFTATGATFYIGGSISNSTIFTHSGGTYNHNNGTLIFDAYQGTDNTYTIDIINGTTSFYNVSDNCSPYAICVAAAGDTIDIENNFTHYSGRLNGVWKMEGNLTVGTGSAGGTGTIIFTGAANQTYAYGASGRTANILINKPSGSVGPQSGTNTFATMIFKLASGTFTAPSGNFFAGGLQNSNATVFTHSGGTFNHNNGTVVFDGMNSGGGYTYTVDVLTGTQFYNALGNNYPYSTLTPASGDTLKLLNDFTHKHGYLNGIWSLQGNLTVNTTAQGGTGTIIMTGTADQTYTYTTSGKTAGVKIDKSSGTVSAASGTTNFSCGTFSLIAGTFTAPSSNFYAGGLHNSNTTIFTHAGGTFNHNNGTVVFDGSNGGVGCTYTVDVLSTTQFYSALGNNNPYTTLTTASGDTVKLLNNFTHKQGYINGTWSLQGNLTVNTTAQGGTGTIIFTGTANQTYTYSTSGRTVKLSIDKASGTVSPASGTTAFACMGLNLAAGSFTATTGIFNIATPGGAGSIFDYTAGTFNHNNGMVFFNPTDYYSNQTIHTSAVNFYDVKIHTYSTLSQSSSSDTLKVDHELTLFGGTYGTGVTAVKGKVKVGSSVGNTQLLFCGSTDQDFDLTGYTGNYNGNIKINKPAGKVNLLSACTLDASSQTLTFVKGNIVTTATNLLALGDNVTVSGASNDSYVEGPVKKTGNDGFTFPVGKNGHYRKIGISAPASTSDAFTAEYFEQNSNDTYSHSSKDGSIAELSRNEYWNLARTTGTSNVSVTLSIDSATSCAVDNLSNLKVAAWDGTTWKDKGNGGTSGNVYVGTVVSNGVSSTFGAYTIGTSTTLDCLCDHIVADAGNDTAICYGSEIEIGGAPTATGGHTPYSYVWSPSDFLNNDNIANPTATPDTTISYALTVTDYRGCVARDTFNIEVLEYNNLTDTTLVIKARTLQDTVIHIIWNELSLNPDAKYTLEKSFDGIDFFAIDSIQGDTAQDIMELESSEVNAYAGILYTTEATPSFIYNDIETNFEQLFSLYYRVRIDTMCSTIYTGTVSPTIYKTFYYGLPDLKMTGGCSPVETPPNGYLNSGIEYSILTDNGGVCCMTTYTLYVDSIPAECTPGPCTPAGLISDCNCACSYDECCQHLCIDRDICSCFWPMCNSAGLWIITNSIQDFNAIILLPQDTAICEGDSVLLHLNITPSDNWVYEWYEDGVNDENDTTATIIVSPSQTTTYSIFVSSIDQFIECYIEDSITITVIPTPDIDITTTASLICNGNSTNLHATGSGTYLWSTGATTQNITVSPSITTTYSVNLTNNQGCSDLDSIIVYVNPNPLVDAGNDAALCEGSCIQLSPSIITETSAPYSYNWSPSTGLSCTGCQYPLACPTSTTTYYVAVTDDEGCEATDSITLTVYPAPEAEIIGPTSLCDSVQVFCVDTTAGATYSWEVINGDIVSGDSTNCITVDWGSDLYNSGYVIATVTLDSCSATDSIFVDACCQLPNAPYLSGTHYMSSLALSPPAGMTINYMGTPGFFEITSDFTLNGTFIQNLANVTLNNIEVLLDAGSEIIVNQNCTLNIDASYLHACDTMWNRIYLNQGAHLNVINSSLIEDAESAVYSSRGNYNIDQSYFNKNYKHVVLRNYTAPDDPGDCFGTQFLCHSVNPTTLAVGATTTLKPPYVGQRTNMGFDLLGNMNFNLNAYQQARNTFNNTGFGVFSRENPNIDVSFNNFYNNGIGIYAYRNANIRIEADSLIGIDMLGTYIYESKIGDISIGKNFIHNSPYGIGMYKNKDSDIEIIGNYITFGTNPINTGTGIYVWEPIMYTKMHLDISGNLIDTVRTGISLMNIAGSYQMDINTGSVYIGANSITQRISTNNGAAGILLNNSLGNLVNENTVHAHDDDGTQWWESGIRDELGNSNLYYCNNTHDIGRGIFISGDQYRHYLQLNKFSENMAGVFLNYAVIGPQYFSILTTDYAHDNEWDSNTNWANGGTYDQNTIHCWNSFGVFSQFFVRNGNLPYDPTNGVANSGFASNVIVNILTHQYPYDCEFYEEPEFAVQLPPSNKDYVIALLSDTTSLYSAIDSSGRWMRKKAIYEVLKLDTALRNSDSLIIAFYDSCFESNVGQLERVLQELVYDDKLGRGIAEDFADTLSTMIACCPPEETLRAICLMLCENIADSAELSLQQIDDLRNIAELCPYIDGPGVYMARSLLLQVDTIPQNYYNYCEVDNEPGSGKWEGNNTGTIPLINSHNFIYKLYPNPNNGSMTLEYELNEADKGEVRIYSLLGNLIFDSQLVYGKTSLSIALQNINGGVYFVKVIVNDSIKLSDKVIILRE